MKKRLLSLALTLAMLLTLLPAGALAAAHDHSGYSVFGGTWDAGSYYLADAVTVEDYTNVSDSVDLCLNGKALNISGVTLLAEAELTVSDCVGGGVIQGDYLPIVGVPFMEPYGPSRLVLESGTVKSNEGAAIESGGYVTLKGGEVQGDYGVYYYYLNGDDNGCNASSPITLEGEPVLSGTTADICIYLDGGMPKNFPCIDATAYTGEQVTVELNVSESDGPVDAKGAPIVKLGDTPASKFSLIAGDYTLKEEAVDGVNCLVLAGAPASARLSWSEGSEEKTLDLSAKEIEEYLVQGPADGVTEACLTLVDDAVSWLRVKEGFSLTLTGDGEAERTLTRRTDFEDGFPLLEMGEDSVLTVTNLTLDGTYPGETDNTPPPAAVSVMGSLTLGENAKLINGGQPPAAEAVVPNNAGGVYVYYDRSLQMEPGSLIQNCRGASAGGVMTNGGAFTMNGGAITGNTAVGGGDFSSSGGVAASGAFTMKGGSITGNKAIGDMAISGGVMSLGQEPIVLSGNATIRDNVVAASEDAEEIPANLVLLYQAPYGREGAAPAGSVDDSDFQPVLVSGPLTGSIGVSKLDMDTLWADTPARVTVTGKIAQGKDYTLTQADCDAFFSDDPNYVLTLNTDDNTIYLVEKPAAQAKWGADAENLTTEGTLADALAAAAAENSTVGYIQLVGNVTAADGKTFTAAGGTFTLDLNGHTVLGGAGGNTFSNWEGSPALTVDGANLTLTNTAETGGALKGGQGGTYRTNASGFNHGGPGVEVNSGALTVDSDGVTLTCGDPGPECTTEKRAYSAIALSIWGGETILKAGCCDASVTAEGKQFANYAILVSGGVLTVPKDSTLLATADNEGEVLYMSGGTTNIAGGTFGDPNALPDVGVKVAGATCAISGGSFSGSNFGLDVWYDTAQVTLSGGRFSGERRAVNLPIPEPGDMVMTYADLLADGYGFSADGSAVITDEDTLSSAKALSVIPAPTAVQAKWGVDADNLTGEGTLADALAAAAAENSTVAYIQLADNVTAADGETHTASGGTFTLDLNGHTVLGGKGDDTQDACEGKPALTVSGANVTLTNTAETDGTLQGGQGGTYADTNNGGRYSRNRGGQGVLVTSGKLTANSQNIMVTVGGPGENCTDSTHRADGPNALELRGGEAILNAGFYRGSAVIDSLFQQDGAGISVAGGVLTVPEDSTLLATAAATRGGDSGVALEVKGGTANIAGGDFGKKSVTVPRDAVRVSGGTLNISGGSFYGEWCGLSVYGSSCQIALSGGVFGSVSRGNAADISSTSPLTLFDLPAKGYGWSSDGSTVITKEGAFDLTYTLYVIPLPHKHAVSVDCSTKYNTKTFTLWDKADSLPTEAGNYYLTKDVTLSQQIWNAPASGTTSICLNGHTIKLAKDSYTNGALYIDNGATLSLCDCGEGGTVATERDEAVLRVLNGTLNLYGGTVTGVRTGVLVSGGAFHMYGGGVKDSANESGNGVTVYEGTFLMEGGTVSGHNTGVEVHPDGTFRVKGNVVVTGNTKANVRLVSEEEITGDDPMIPSLGETRYAVMELCGALGQNADIGLSEFFWREVDKAENGLLAVQGAEGYTITANDLKKFSSDNDKYQLTLKNDGKVYFGVKPSHTHSWATAWTSNSTHHWHECTASGCNVTANADKNGYAAHVWDNDADTTCNTCGATRTVTPGPNPPAQEHTHAWATAWTNNDTHHWHECTADGCDVTEDSGKNGYAAHTPGDWITDTPATTQAAGSKHKECTACAYKTETATIPQLDPSHTHSFGETWKTDATHHWHECTCGEKSAQAAHTWDEGKVTTQPTVNAEGVKTYTCTVCQATKTESVPKLDPPTPDNPTFAISGTVTDHAGTGLAAAHVTLTQGSAVIATTQTDDQGNYSFANVPAGLYNVAAERDGVTKTILVELTDANATEKNIRMPEGKTTSVVEVKGEDTPAAVVGGVDAVAEAETVRPGDTVTVKLTVEAKETPADKAELDTVISGKKDDVLYLDLSLVKQVNDQAPETIPDTGDKVLEIVVPYDFTGKKDVTVYRKHGTDNAAALTKLTARPTGDFRDGTFYADGVGKVYIYASKFSTYAIGYTAQAEEPTPTRRPSRRPARGEETAWPFADVTEQDWHYEGVKYVYEKGLMEGTSDTTFAPGMDTSRAMIATILWRLSGSPEPEAGLTYPDCKAGSWYAKAVAWGTEAGILKGYNTGDFGPDDPITREQLALMLWRYAKSPETAADLDEFVDGRSVSGWVYPAMEWAVEQGIITGKHGNVLDPQGHATRAEAATMLARFCVRKK